MDILRILKEFLWGLIKKKEYSRPPSIRHLWKDTYLLAHVIPMNLVLLFLDTNMWFETTCKIHNCFLADNF